MNLVIALHSLSKIKELFPHGCQRMLVLTQFVKKNSKIEFIKESTLMKKTLQSGVLATSKVTRLVL